MGTSVIRSNFLEKVVQLSLHSRDPPIISLRNPKRLSKPIMNPATSILFLGLVLSTAQGFEVKSFKADPEKPAKDEKVTLTATPDGDLKTCVIKLDTKEICKIKIADDAVTGKGKAAGHEDKYECIAKKPDAGADEDKNGNCGVIVTNNQGGKWEVTMTGADDTPKTKALELKAEANGAGIPQIGMAVWIQLASTFALYKMAF